MKKLSVTICLLISAACFAQSDKDAVASAVTDYIDVFYYGDSIKLHRSISPAVYKWGYWRHRDSANYNSGEQMTWKQIIDYAARVKARNNPSEADKFVKKVEVLDVQDKTAAAKCTAWWGTDYLLLAKQNDKWIITQILWQSPPPKK